MHPAPQGTQSLCAHFAPHGRHPLGLQLLTKVLPERVDISRPGSLASNEAASNQEIGVLQSGFPSSRITERFSVGAQAKPRFPAHHCPPPATTIHQDLGKSQNLRLPPPPPPLLTNTVSLRHHCLIVKMLHVVHLGLAKRSLGRSARQQGWRWVVLGVAGS